MRRFEANALSIIAETFAQSLNRHKNLLAVMKSRVRAKNRIIGWICLARIDGLSDLLIDICDRFASNKSFSDTKFNAFRYHYVWIPIESRVVSRVERSVHWSRNLLKNYSTSFVDFLPNTWEIKRRSVNYCITISFIVNCVRFDSRLICFGMIWEFVAWIQLK